MFLPTTSCTNDSLLLTPRISAPGNNNEFTTAKAHIWCSFLTSLLTSTDHLQSKPEPSTMYRNPLTALPSHRTSLETYTTQQFQVFSPVYNTSLIQDLSLQKSRSLVHIFWN